MSTQVLDTIEIKGEVWRLSCGGLPNPVPNPAPRGLHVEWGWPSPSINRGWVAKWRLHDGGLYLVHLEGYGDVRSLPEPHMEGGYIIVRHRDFGIPDVFGGTDPVPATWVTADLKLAWDRSTFRNSQLGTQCSLWRILSFTEGVLTGDRLARGDEWGLSP